MNMLWLVVLSYGAAYAVESSKDAQKLIDSLYQERAGYTINSTERNLIAKNGSDCTYGEILPESLDRLFKELKVSANDVFVDLGCGVGKAVLHAYLTTPMKKSMGIELSKTRADLARKALAKLKSLGKLEAGRTVVIDEQDFVKSEFPDATIIFINSVCYSDELLQKVLDKVAKLKRGARVISTKTLPNDKRFKLIKDFNLPMSWSKDIGSPVYIYRLV